jgi:hypothetical protein
MKCIFFVSDALNIEEDEPTSGDADAASDVDEAVESVEEKEEEIPDVDDETDKKPEHTEL